MQPGLGAVTVSLVSRREHLADAVALVAELLQPPPLLTWLVRDYLLPESNIFVVGEPAAGKSLLMLDWACCIAKGIAWQGQPVR